MVKSPLKPLFRGGGRNHLLLPLLDNLRPLGCHTVRPLCRPEKGHRDLTSLSIVAVRAGWWVLKLVSLHPELRVGMRRQQKNKTLPMVSLSSGGKSHHHEPPLCKGRWLPVGQTEGLYVTSLAKYNPSAPSGQLPLHKGAFGSGCPQCRQPSQRLLPPAGEEAGRRSLTDGGGGCKALGTVEISPRQQPAQTGMLLRSMHPQSVLRTASSLLRKEPYGGTPLRQTAPS